MLWDGTLLNAAFLIKNSWVGGESSRAIPMTLECLHNVVFGETTLWQTSPQVI